MPAFIVHVMADVAVVIPTYDEKENVGPISREILRVKPDVSILFVDGNSPDGTGKILDDLSAADNRIHVLHSPAKEGLGRAYISGYRWSLERGYRFIIGMDADFSHDPAEIPNLLKAAQNADLVIGSRYINGIRVANWPLSRLILSKMAGAYVRLITGMPIADPTGGYRCYRSETLVQIELDTILSNGYSFLVETAHRAWIRGFRIVELPITFVDRRSGYSKMSMDIFKESLWMVWKLALLNGFRRSPMKRRSGTHIPAPNRSHE